MVSQSEMIPFSLATYKELINNAELSSNAESVNKLREVGSRVRDATIMLIEDGKNNSFLDDFQWEFQLIESEQVNAWAMPGGGIAFYRGILALCENDNEIAAVMAHMVAHLVANHAGERMHQQLAENFGASIYSRALSENPNLTKQLLLRSVGFGSQVGMMPFTNAQVKEADEIGLKIMAKAGYSPRAALDFWLKLREADEQSSEVPTLLFTHPVTNTRISNINNKLPEALVILRDSPFLNR
jgi:predicted Zn-dependent protease